MVNPIRPSLAATCEVVNVTRLYNEGYGCAVEAESLWLDQ
jgi:hypothetical protein